MEAGVAVIALLWITFRKVIVNTFALRATAAAALVAADGPLWVGDLVAAGIVAKILWDIYHQWDALWAAALRVYQQQQSAPVLTPPRPRPYYSLNNIRVLSMFTHRIEYLLLRAVIESSETLKNVSSDCNFPRFELALAANRLFQNGDILASLFTGENQNNTKDIILTMAQIQSHLDGKLIASYYLTPQGGARWEALSHPDWNLYHKWNVTLENNSKNRVEIIGSDRQLVEKLLSVSYLHGGISLPETETWEDLVPWQATYWKTLPKAYKVSYQSTNFEYPIHLNDSQNWIDADREARTWHSKILHWYTEPELDSNPSILFDNTAHEYCQIPAEKSDLKVEYLILEMAVIFPTYSLGSIAYSKNISYSEIARAAYSLFERGEIRARVFADEYDDEGTSDVILTMPGIQDHLSGRIRAFYYLTPQGGERWETLSSPDWNKFLIVNLLSIFPYEEGILGTQRENIEKLLSIEKFVLSHKHIPGTENWKVIKPWQATYWKTLPIGYRVDYEYKTNSQTYWNLAEDTPAELIESYNQASIWYENIKKWYTNPYSN